MKKFFKKIINKVKEVIHMAVNASKETTAAKAEFMIHTEDLVVNGINALGTSVFGYLENKDNIKAAEKEKVIDAVDDILSGIKRNSKYVGVIGIFVGVGVGLCIVSVASGLIFADKLA